MSYTFTLKEKYSWSNGNDTVKLRDVIGDDGAIKLVVKPQWRVKIKVEANYVAALKFLKNSIGVELSEATKEQVPNRITQFYESFTGGKATVWLILDGDVGDRIEFDLDSEYGSIENIYIKTGGEVFSQFMSKMDAGASDDSMKITLAGVYYKPSEYGEGKIESHREYEIVHDIENGLIQAVDADGQVIFSQTYLVNTDPKAVRNYIVGEIDYAEQVKTKGFNFMNSPGYDPVSVTGQVASGANLICFTTGRGSCFGFKPTPSIKIATNTNMYNKLSEDMDINAGTIMDNVASVNEVGKEIFDKIISVASGEKSKSEINDYGDDEFNPWIIGATL